MPVLTIFGKPSGRTSGSAQVGYLLWMLLDMLFWRLSCCHEGISYLERMVGSTLVSSEATLNYNIIHVARAMAVCVMQASSGN